MYAGRLGVVILTVLSSSLLPAFGGPRLEDPLVPVTFETIHLDGFWKQQVKRLTEQWIPHCLAQMEEGGRGQELMNLVHCSRILRGEAVEETFTGAPWSDAYVYNTIEAACLALAVDPSGDPALAEAQAMLRGKIAEWIPIMLAAQADDGYIHSYHIVNQRPRYSNIHMHEFYVQGYFLEMGVAHYRMTGGQDTRLYDAARRCADQLCANFGPPPKRNWVYGHAGMGYALCRLADLVDEVEGEGQGEPYVALAKYLFDHRHTDPQVQSPYNQTHRPVVEMEHAVGHAVRATYFYTGIADLAMRTGDEAYLVAADRIWENAIQRKHYVTGGVGASHEGEAFAGDYDLRNDAYCESCAGCGMAFWAGRMHRIHRDAHYADVQERVLYNNLLGSIDLAGVNFFYQNPLDAGNARYPWHACPCCVGNIPRALVAIKDQMYALNASRDQLYVHHFVASDGTIEQVAGTTLRIRQRTAYPWQGEVTWMLDPAQPVPFTLYLRVPNRAESALYTVTPELSGDVQLEVNGEAQSVQPERGYLALTRTWRAGDRVVLTLPMEVQRVTCDDRVQANRGYVALQRGPLVYNIEEVDHEKALWSVVLPPEAPLDAVWKPDLLEGVTVLESVETGLTAIPHHVRLNRGGRSRVWIPANEAAAEASRPPGEKLLQAIVADPRTVDFVRIGVDPSEQKHHLQGERTGAGTFKDRSWRHATDGGWFSYRLNVHPNRRQVLVCTYWGSDVGNRIFDLFVDGEKVGEEVLQSNKPDAFFSVEYPLPTSLTNGKDHATVTARARPGATAGGLFDHVVMRTINE